MKKLNSAILYLFLLGFLSFIVSSCGDASNAKTSEQASIATTGSPELDAISAAISKEADNPDLYYQRAKVYYDLEGYDQAIEDLRIAMIGDSTKVEYFHLLADVYLDNYNSRMALHTMNNAVERFPKRVPTLLKLSEFQLILKQYEQSIKTAAKVLEIDPEQAEGFIMLGMNFRENGDTTKAINSFQTAVELEPDLIDAWIMLGNLWEAKGESIAERYFNSAVAIDPENIKSQSARGSYFLRTGSLEKAKADFNAIIKKDIQNSSSFYNLGLVYLEQDSIKLANEKFNIAIETNPLFMKAYYYRGVTHEALGRPDRALADYKQLSRHDPSYRDVADRIAKLSPES